MLTLEKCTRKRVNIFIIAIFYNIRYQVEERKHSLLDLKVINASEYSEEMYWNCVNCSFNFNIR